jgi:hypothetical protein
MPHRLAIAFGTVILTIALGATLAIPLGTTPSPAQSVRVETAAPQVYQRLPNFPLANQYRNRASNNVDPNNTLVNRLIRYHVYRKGRPPTLRLDWKHTIADYFGANETIDPSTYPTQERLSENPLEADRAIMTQLSRRDRETLIQALIAALSPPRSVPQPTPAPTANPIAPPTPPRTAPQPGGADLLK